MSSLEFDYLHYPLRLYYNSLFIVIQSLVFYPPPFLGKVFYPTNTLGHFQSFTFCFLKSFLEKMIGHLLSSSSTQKKTLWTSQYSTYSFYKVVTNGVLSVWENFFEVQFPHCFLIKDFHDYEKRSEEGHTNFESKFREF